ncbi:uncharacterized protein LOC123878065 isoform X2 [Maniola jurtina]|uniref:uncharacterized protein LOC123878065 isoform X2 n=1 Tax=Maniola jurtina TaxID=191418 RepID=UPI001E68FACE|nr:uncharacterized protein LOC123878065 isoform X2 [Maniola jurtina]
MDTFKLKISTEQLIQAVHSRSCLWNKYDVTYRDKKARDKSWTEVYKEVFPEFDMLKEIMRSRVGQQISKKWFNIRDAYVKASKQRRSYIYMNILGFLDPVIQGDKSGAQESFLDDADDQNENWFQTSFVDIDETPKKKIKRDKIEVTDKDYLEIIEPDNNSLVAILARLVEKEDDDDKLFFTSLIPSVKSLTENAKFEFKIQVMKLLKEFKMKDKVGGFVKMRDSDTD